MICITLGGSEYVIEITPSHERSSPQPLSDVRCVSKTIYPYSNLYSQVKNGDSCMLWRLCRHITGISLAEGHSSGCI